jgi:hypothetical protein
MKSFQKSLMAARSAMLSGGQVHQANQQRKRCGTTLEKLAAGQIKPDRKHDELSACRTVRRVTREDSNPTERIGRVRVCKMRL